MSRASRLRRATWPGAASRPSRTRRPGRTARTRRSRRGTIPRRRGGRSRRCPSTSSGEYLGSAAVAPRIVLLPGDGIGPEIMAAARELLAAVGDFDTEEQLVGGASIDANGSPLTDEVLTACRGADAVLLAAVGGPKWDTTDPHAPRPEQGLLGLRKELGLFANLRPVRPAPALLDASPLKRDRIEGTDLLVVRELTGGIYFGERGRTQTGAHDTLVYSEEEIDRICEGGFRFARQHLTSFDVIVTENMFGDILSDVAAMLTGSIGMLPSASVGPEDGPGMFEPVHGSAPDIAGTGKANPLAMFGSVAMMLRYGLDREDDAVKIESAIDRALEEGLRTADLGGDATTEDATEAILTNL